MGVAALADKNLVPAMRGMFTTARTVATGGGYKPLVTKTTTTFQ